VLEVTHEEGPVDRCFTFECLLAAMLFLALLLAIPWFLNYWFGG
jgi:hypothetical protein